MKAKQKTILRLAVAAAFTGAAVSANAGLLQNASITAFVPAHVASELPTTGIVLTAATTELTTGTQITPFTASAGQNLLINVTLNSGAKFSAAPTLSCYTSTGNAAGVLNLGGAGSNQAIWSVGTAQITGAMTSCYVTATTLTVTGAHADVSLSVTYTYGTLASSTDGGTYVHFLSGLTATKVAGSDVVAQVTASFMTVTAALNASGTIVSAGQANWIGNNSAASTATNLATYLQLGDALGASSGSITVAGPALAATKTGTGSSAGIWLISADGNTCVAGGTVVASAVGGVGSVTFTGLTPAQMSAGVDVCLQFTGTTAIQAGSITAQVGGTALSGYSLPTPAALTLMNITRNGTQLIAPLVQIPSGFLSRMVIMNTGPAAAYSVSTVSETGTTATPTGAASSGTVPASGLTVVDLPANLSITAGQPQRTSFSITVNGASTNINGLYQIVDPSGAVSNYVMHKQ